MAKTTKRNPPDQTPRNTQASRKAERGLGVQIQLLKNAVRQTRSRVTALEHKAGIGQ